MNQIKKKIPLLLIAIIIALGISMSYPAMSADVSNVPEEVQSQTIEDSGYFLDEYKEPEIVESKSAASLFISFLWKLCVVVLMIYFTIKFLRLFYTKQFTVDSGFSNIAIIDSFYLKPTQAIYIVKIVDRFYSLGITSSSITIINELNEDEVKSLMENNRVVLQRGTGFKNRVMAMLGKEESTLDTKVKGSSERILSSINKIAEDG